MDAFGRAGLIGTAVLGWLCLWPCPLRADASGPPQSDVRIVAERSIGRIRVPPRLILRERRVTLRPSAEVSQLSFDRISGTQARWRGRLRGSGKIYLRLLILRQGEVESARLLGSVQMREEEHSISFNYVGSLPQGGGWEWKITAEAR
jgi:hypothetical protein